MALTKITNDLLDLGSDTGALGLPKGTEAQRPSNPVEGTLRHNSEIDETKLETFDGTDWMKINKFVATPSSYSISYLLIAGGGGGGGTEGGNATVYAAGGGAGGYKYQTNITFLKSVQYNIQVGAGGTGGSGQGVVFSTDGLNSQISGSNITTTIAYGGEGGGKVIASVDPSNAGASGFLPSNPGGTSYSGGAYWGGGGGGGIGSNGGGGGGSSAGNGGNGLQFDITGSNIYYGGGGGGGIYQLGTGGSGGAGGGGAGLGTNGNGGNGTNNLGGGGGAAGSAGGQNGTYFVGGSGGSGVVIIRMPTASYTGNTTGSPTVTTDGTDTILTYTRSGTYTA